MRRVWILGLVVLAFAVADQVAGQQSALRGLPPPTISTKTVDNQSALKAPNMTRPLQTPARAKSPSLGLPKLSLTTWPPRFSTASILPRTNNPFQPKAPKGNNPFETGKVVKK